MLKSSATGNSQEGTIGSIVTSSFVNTGYTFNIQNLLTNFIGRYSAFANLPVGTLLLRIQYPLQMISLIEDAVVAIPDNLNELVFEDFEGIYTKLTDKAQEFKDKIIENLDNENFQRVGNEEDISDHLDRFIFDCNLTRFKVLFDEYQKRVKEIAQESLLSEYAKKHPGLEHTGGVPKGGTFVLIYHDQAYATPTPNRPSLSSGNVLTNAGRTGVFTKANSPSRLSLLSDTTSSKATASENITAGRAASEASLSTKVGATLSSNLTTGLTINSNFLLANQLTLDLSRLVNKVVVGDLSLPYMCKSDCPSVTYVFPSVELSLSLPKNVFCQPDRDEATYPFAASPEGGEVKGAGVEKNENGVFVFNPSAKEVNVGMQTFTYELDGKTATLQVEVVAAPKANFEIINFDPAGNAIYIFTKNNSENADSFLWEANGQVISTDRELDVSNNPFTLPNQGSEIQLKLTATNKACFDTAVQKITVAAEALLFETENGETSFCGDNKESIGLVTKPEGGKVTANSSDFKISKNGNKFSFTPAANPTGLYELTYTDPDGRTAKLQILISQPNAQFTINPTDADGMLVFMDFIPVDRTGELYTWTDGTTELIRTNKLPNPGPNVSVDFSNQNQKTFTLRVNQGQCSSRFSLTTDVKTLLATLRNRNANGGTPTRGSSAGSSLSAGRGSNTITITNLGRNSSGLINLLTTELAVDSVELRKSLSNLPFTISGISNASMKTLEADFTRNQVIYTKQ